MQPLNIVIPCQYEMTQTSAMQGASVYILPKARYPKLLCIGYVYYAIVLLLRTVRYFLVWIMACKRYVSNFAYIYTHSYTLVHSRRGGGDSCSALSTDIDEMCLRSIPYGFYNYPPRCGLGRCRGRNRGNNVKQGTLMGIILLKYQCTCPWGKLSATHETHTCSIRDRSPRHCQEVQVYEHISHPTAQHSWSDIVVRLWIGSYCDKW